MGFINTSDTQKEDFRTRWYRNSIEQIEAAAKTIAESRGYVYIDKVEQYHELYFRSSKYELVVIITSKNPRKTAVDLSLEAHSFFSFGYKKEAIAIYDEFNKKLDFIGKGLN